ncbi:ABC transporter permease [Cerasicoccus arenae]|uniref:Uncharacterized protein n=1 Tax=Cerasicoccus arenae TaxID=424488 RepID=A0A8J3DHB6_9BACT|nr:hypothetical protein [Cerasicoccus arenae]MBK1859580.1 hypothetical protein [Cerasicoccus arenae]GHB92851.1 hypothetical protein GCM10007047_05190 [Cerasicoccus arenae]
MLKKLLGKREISDWINPVIVKELRQSVRSRQFVSMFVIVQIIMILFVTFGLATATGTRDMEGMSALFWTIISIYLLMILPLMGLNALAREFDDARLDLLQLTSLNARGIVFGKWLSLNIQGWLVVLSLLPYIALRYFVGAVNPLHDLAALGWILYGSLICTGGAICVSVVHSKVLRILMIIVGIIAFFVAVNIMAVAGLNPDDILSYLETTNLWVSIPLILLLSVPIGGLFLEFASARISPMAENHETPKRFYLLAIFGLWGIAYYVDIVQELYLAGVFMAMIAVTISCVVNEPIALPGIYRPFLRFGGIGKFLGRMFLYPGWPAGSNFVVAVCGLTIGILLLLDNGLNDIELVLLQVICALGSLLLPRAIIILFKMRNNSGMRLFMLIQLVAICLTVLAMLVEETRDWPYTNILFFVPQAGLLCAIGSIEPETSKYMLFLIGSIVTTAISYMVILFATWRLQEPQKILEDQATQILEKQKAAKAQALAAQSSAPAEA